MFGDEKIDVILRSRRSPPHPAPTDWPPQAPDPALAPLQPKLKNVFSDNFNSSDDDGDPASNAPKHSSEEDIGESIKRLRMETEGKSSNSTHSHKEQKSSEGLPLPITEKFSHPITPLPPAFASFGGAHSLGSSNESQKESHTVQEEEPLKETSTSFMTVNSNTSKVETDLSRRKTEKTISKNEFQINLKPSVNSVGSHSSNTPEHNIYTFLTSGNYKALRSLDMKSALYLSGLLADDARFSVSKRKKVSKEKVERKRGLPILVMDLFNSLVYCAIKKDRDNKGKKQLILRTRPFLKFFLENLREKARLVIFSSVNASEVTKVARFIDPDREYFSEIFSKSDCKIDANGNLIKSLDIFKESDNLLYIDQKFVAYDVGVGGFVPIKPFNKHNKNDDELLKLCEYLEELLKMYNRRADLLLPQLNEQTLQFRRFLEAFDLKQYLSSL